MNLTDELILDIIKKLAWISDLNSDNEEGQDCHEDE